MSGTPLSPIKQRDRLGVVRWLTIVLLTFSLAAAACGDSDDDGTAADGGEAGAEADDAASDDEAATDDGSADEAASDDDSTGDDAAAVPSGDPIKIGTLTSLDGPFTPWGVQARDGMQLAVDEINAAGGVDGRPLELIVMNDQSNAEEGITGMERLLDDGVVAVGGPISSDVGLAVARLAEESEVPLFLVKAGSEAILTADSRYTFRTCIPSAPMVAQPILEYAQQQGFTKIGAIVADYAWGQAIKGAMEDTFATDPAIEFQIEVAPVGESDFTTYLRSLDGFGPDLLVATGHPPGAGAITVQSAEIGMTQTVTGAYFPLSLLAGSAGEAAVGRFADFGCADYDSPGYQELAARYLAVSDNTFMEDDAVAGYGIVQMVAEAITEVGDDPVAVSEYLHANTFDLPGYAWEMGWTEWGEMNAATVPMSVIGEGPAPGDTNSDGTWYPETLSVSDTLTPYKP